MAAACSFLSPANLSIQSCGFTKAPYNSKRTTAATFAQQQQQQQPPVEVIEAEETATALPEREAAASPPATQRKPAQSLPAQPNAESKNMPRDYGGQWLSSVTRHVRIYAAYIDPVTHAFDQTQTDRLTLMLDPSDEFAWTPEACQKVYDYFQELVDHYEGAPLEEYTLRLIGSDIEHYIRKLLYDGEIKYNINARVLNFSMGKPRVKFNANQIEGTT